MPSYGKVILQVKTAVLLIQPGKMDMLTLYVQSETPPFPDFPKEAPNWHLNLRKGYGRKWIRRNLPQLKRYILIDVTDGAKPIRKIIKLAEGRQ